MFPKIHPCFYMDDKARLRSMTRDDIRVIEDSIKEVFNTTQPNIQIFSKSETEWSVYSFLYSKTNYPIRWHSFWINYKDGIFLCGGYKFGVDPCDMWSIHNDGQDWHGRLYAIEGLLSEAYQPTERNHNETAANIPSINYEEMYATYIPNGQCYREQVETEGNVFL